MKKHKIKEEQPEGSSGRKTEKQNDLAYFIHDRVELLHQAFSLMKPKEIKAMAPDCVRDVSIDDLQELCLEELLGISSKRLLSALDGVPTPSDTESSSDDTEQQGGAKNFDVISLDSISSDEGALSPGHSSKRSKKHKRCKRRDKRKKSDGKSVGGERERAAERAGLTVLELLELQARARAIRAQLNADIERKNALATITTLEMTSDDDVEIKEEPAEVVLLVSSEDEAKPDLAALQAATADMPAAPAQPEPPPTVTVTEDDTRVVTKRADLTIVVPKAQPTRKIKLNRQKAKGPVTAPNPSDSASTNSTPTTDQNNTEKEPITEETKTQRRVFLVKSVKSKKKKAKKNKKPHHMKDAEGSDHDEITLQLSDSEKMDLLEDFDRKNYDLVSSSNSEDDSEDSGSIISGDHIAEQEPEVTINSESDASAIDKENCEDTSVHLTGNNVQAEKSMLVIETVTIESIANGSEICSITEHKNSSENEILQAEINTEENFAVEQISGVEQVVESNKDTTVELENTAQESIEDQQSTCKETENIIAEEKEKSIPENYMLEEEKSHRSDESCDNNAIVTTDNTGMQPSEVVEAASNERQ